MDGFIFHDDKYLCLFSISVFWQCGKISNFGEHLVISRHFDIPLPDEIPFEHIDIISSSNPLLFPKEYFSVIDQIADDSVGQPTCNPPENGHSMFWLIHGISHGLL
ncbi:MAG: hypothetical protein IKX30_03820 [Victivallales bacterium]|nr:hypothetical protein [Victivallales bacterium]